MVKILALKVGSQLPNYSQNGNVFPIYCRFGQLSNVVGTQHLGYQKIRALLRIPKGSEEEVKEDVAKTNHNRF